jgi:hypothetical protein
MARPTEELVLAWNALSGQLDAEGWRCISLPPAGACVLMAGRRFPGNEESLLVGFSTVSVPKVETLPEGLGFEVSRADPHGDGRTWLALTRKESGSTELFAEMAADVAGAMDACASHEEEGLLRALLGRVRSWQEFMRRGVQSLSPEAEIGLIGELSFLDAMLGAGVPASFALEAWVGPIGGIQDFKLGCGAVEVKSTLSSLGFPAKIGSLEQLDDSVRKPIFITGVRFSQRVGGKSLPDLVADIRSRLIGDSESVRMLGDRLLAAGYIESHAGRYPRRFALEGIRILEVGDSFPRIVPGNVPNGISRVAYEIDLDRVTIENVDVVEALKSLGVL